MKIFFFFFLRRGGCFNLKSINSSRRDVSGAALCEPQLPTMVCSARRPTRVGGWGGGGVVVVEVVVVGGLQLQLQHQREDAAGSKIWGFVPSTHLHFKPEALRMFHCQSDSESTQWKLMKDTITSADIRRNNRIHPGKEVPSLSPHTGGRISTFLSCSSGKQNKPKGRAGVDAFAGVAVHQLPFSLLRGEASASLWMWLARKGGIDMKNI